MLVALLAAACADFEPGPPPADAGAEDAAPMGGDGGAGFAARVSPILRKHCEACHRVGGAAAGSRLVLTGEPGRDWQTVRTLVSPSSPAASALLVEAAGQGHGGGAILGTDEPDYRALLEWIGQGALP